MSFRRSMLCALPLTALACQITPDLADIPPPASNVIVIMTDDQG